MPVQLVAGAQLMAARHCFQPLPVHAEYDLRGPQVQPDASYWHTPPCRPLCIVRPEDLRCRIRRYPTDPAVIADELQELSELKQLRDDPRAIAGDLRDARRRRLQISPLLQLRPPPLGGVFNRRRPDPHPLDRSAREQWPIDRPDPFSGHELSATEVPVITTGRELARFFEDETPAMPLRHALNAILAQPEFRRTYSPPYQALIWCALDITVYSALLAAWYFKWRGPVGVRYRPRPAEVSPAVSVLYDRAHNDSQSGDDGLRTLPPRSPGTPRHPAYPSGHSTHYAAGAELLAAFFPDLRAELEQLADNAGMARLWAGVHWRSDHLWGLELGRCVAQHVIAQLQASCVCPPDPCNPPPACEEAPSYGQISGDAAEHRECCVRGRTATDREAEPDVDGEDWRPTDEEIETMLMRSGQLPQLDRSQQPEVEEERNGAANS